MYFLIYLWRGRWAPCLTPLPSWRSSLFTPPVAREDPHFIWKGHKSGNLTSRLAHPPFFPLCLLVCFTCSQRAPCSGLAPGASDQSSSWNGWADVSAQDVRWGSSRDTQLTMTHLLTQAVVQNGAWPPASLSSVTLGWASHGPEGFLWWSSPHRCSAHCTRHSFWDFYPYWPSEFSEQAFEGAFIIILVFIDRNSKAQRWLFAFI